MNPSKKTLLSRVLFCALAGLIACSATSEDETDSDEQAATALAGDDDDLDILDRMGRPEMTNVTIGSGLVRLREANIAFAKAKAADPESDATKALGAELARLATELGKQGSATYLREANADKAAAAAGEAPRVVSAYIRAYNRQSTFHPLPEERADARKLLGAGIRALDTMKLNGGEADPQDWSEDELAKVTDILSEDALVVDIGGTCTQDARSFFAIEREELDGTQAGSSCGGRVINDDIVDEILTMWVTKTFDFSDANPRRVSDNVSAVAQPTTIPFGAGTLTLSPAIATFPYLGPPRAVPLFVAPPAPASAPSDRDAGR